MHPFFRLRPSQVDVEKSMLQRRPFHLHPVRKNEAADEAARRYAPMQVGLVGLAGGGFAPAADDELAVLYGHGEESGQIAWDCLVRLTKD